MARVTQSSAPRTTCLGAQLLGRHRRASSARFEAKRAAQGRARCWPGVQPDGGEAAFAAARARPRSRRTDRIADPPKAPGTSSAGVEGRSDDSGHRGVARYSGGWGRGSVSTTTQRPMRSRPATAAGHSAAGATTRSAGYAALPTRLFADDLLASSACTRVRAQVKGLTFLPVCTVRRARSAPMYVSLVGPRRGRSFCRGRIGSGGQEDRWLPSRGAGADWLGMSVPIRPPGIGTRRWRIGADRDCR